MKERGKAIFRDASQIPCDKHPHSSHVGICPYCLTHKLMKLLCSECGKICVSSCSCSNRNSCTLFDVGSVGRLSFLIDNENENIDNPHSNSKSKNIEKVVLLRRSSSSCAEIKKKNGFWKIKGLFGKKRNTNGDEYSEISRSASFSNAKISDVSRGVFFDSNINQFGCFSNQMEIERVCNFPNRSVFPIKGSDFNPVDDSEFIDLKLDSLSKSNQDFFYGGGINGVSDHANVYKNGNSEIGGNLASLKSIWGLWKRGFLQGRNE